MNNLVDEINALKQQVAQLQQNFTELSEWVQFRSSLPQRVCKKVKITIQVVLHQFSRLKLLDEIITEDNKVTNSYKGKRTSGNHSRYTIVHHNAASTIQALYRGMRTRKRIREYLKQVEAATKIQAAWRGFYTRFKLRKERRKIIASIMQGTTSSGNKSVVLALADALEQEISRRKMLEEAVKTLWEIIRKSLK